MSGSAKVLTGKVKLKLFSSAAFWSGIGLARLGALLTMLPAMRIEKMSPSPWSKMSSAEVRLSMQERTVATGH